MKELVSIIVPFYNDERFVKNVIQQVEQQTYSNIELICIDDGSTDGTLEILEQIKMDKFKYRYVTQKNGGGIQGEKSRLSYS